MSTTIESAGVGYGPVRRLLDEWRPRAITLGAPVFPLAVLLALNTVDELDRSAFAVLLPEIREHFGLTNAAALGLVAATTIAVVVIELPLAYLADRANRVRIAALGAAAWALFSGGTAAAMSVPMLVAMRIGSGSGKSVVTPTHSSLLADYYPPEARVKVFAAHRLGSSIGQIAAPLLAGVLAAVLGWRAPFLLFAFPTVLLVVLALRLREPERGGHDDSATAVAPTSVLGSIRDLGAVPVIRRMWMAAPFLGIALFAVPNLLALVYEDVFSLSSAQRGAIAAGVEPLQIIGVLVSMPLVARRAAHDATFLLRFIAAVAVVDSLLLVALAYSPNAGMAVVVHAALAASVATVAPAFYALVSLVAPAHVRSVAFSTMSLFAIPGVAVFLPLVGAISDAVGVQLAIATLVPLSAIAAALLASASRAAAGIALAPELERNLQ